jgi:hypothetical protein
MTAMGPTSYPYADDRVMVATIGPVVVPVVGRIGYSVESARAQARAIEAHGRTVGARRMIELSLIDAEVPIPDADVRAVLDRGVPVISPYYRAVSAVFPGSGFRAALIRGVIMSFQLLSRSAYPQKVFATIDAAAAFSHAHALAADPALDGLQALAAGIADIAAEAARRGVLSEASVKTMLMGLHG